MKIKYFLRGLGIGILVTTLLLHAGSAKSDSGALTDEQIIQQARKLGMMTEEEVKDYRLDQNLQNLKESLSGSENPIESVSPSPVADTDQKASESTSPSAAEETKEAGKEEDNSAAKKTNQKKQQGNKKETKKDEQGEQATRIQIEAGSTLKSVAQMLQQKKLIDSIVNFTDYVKERELTEKIIAGDYDIPAGASYAEIIEIITRLKK